MNTTISFQLLLLNDLLNSGVIDQDLYDKAAHKITSAILNTSQSLPTCA